MKLRRLNITYDHSVISKHGKKTQIISGRNIRRVKDRLKVVLRVGVQLYVSLRGHPLSRDDIAEGLCVYEPETSAWVRRDAAQPPALHY